MADARGPDPAAPTPGSAPDGHRFDSGWEPQARDTRQLRPSVPQSFQTRLTFAFMGVVALTLILVAPVVINRLDDYFRQLEEQGLRSRADATAQILGRFMIDLGPGQPGRRPRARGRDARCSTRTRRRLLDGPVLDLTASQIAQADTVVTVGLVGPDTDGFATVMPDPDLSFEAQLQGGGDPGQVRDPAIAPQDGDYQANRRYAAVGPARHAVEPVHEPRGDARQRHGLILVMASVAFLVAVLVAAFLAHRFTTPAHPPDRGEPAARGGRPRLAGGLRRAVHRHARAPGAVASSSTRWRTGSRRA